MYNSKISNQRFSLKVLLLEDDPALNDLLNEHLCDKGYDVTLCMNGQEALENLVSEIFDLALLDINTPLMSGRNNFV